MEESSKEELLNGGFKYCKYEYGKLSLGVHLDILMVTHSQVERAWSRSAVSPQQVHKLP
ncbi:hypothetical protein LR48_Vigan08g087900 [Vigna angularis]|uniref:Uncharacterized protein n=1 Tax=Phaseolus angularis TaxID=3914 RepID=A0A0L9V536_PHAAN|nr:hypothetical protein LR48_Vigan08g087900 [Vigna angularis]